MLSNKKQVLEPRRVIGTKKPLFDRLIDHNLDDGFENAKSNYMDKEQLIDSIIHEISLLLNTRITSKLDEYIINEALDKTVLAYGIPTMFGLTDLSSLDGASRHDWAMITQVCESAIEAFEPRIKNPHVEIDHFENSEQKLYIHVTADLNLHYIQEEVSFPIAIDYSDEK